MKKCPVCNRTYADETLSFCLEDGSLLSASFNFYEEQETVVSPTKTKSAPIEYFPVETDYYSERATVASAEKTNLIPVQSAEKQINIHLIILCIIWISFLMIAAYTGSIIPLLVALVLTLIYKAAQSFIKRAI